MGGAPGCPRLTWTSIAPMIDSKYHPIIWPMHVHQPVTKMQVRDSWSWFVIVNLSIYEKCNVNVWTHRAYKRSSRYSFISHRNCASNSVKLSLLLLISTPNGCPKVCLFTSFYNLSVVFEIHTHFTSPREESSNELLNRIWHSISFLLAIWKVKLA